MSYNIQRIFSGQKVGHTVKSMMLNNNLIAIFDRNYTFCTQKDKKVQAEPLEYFVIDKTKTFIHKYLKLICRFIIINLCLLFLVWFFISVLTSAG